MRHIGTVGLAFAAACILSCFTAGSASAWCRHVKTSELSLYTAHGWFGCTGVVAGLNGFVKTSTYKGKAVGGGGEAGVLCYRVQTATQPSAWKNDECTELQVPGEMNQGGFVKIEVGTKSEEETAEEGEGSPELTLLAGEKLPVTFTGKGESVTLETTGGTSLTCTAHTVKGEITSATLGTISFDLTGCKSSKVACSSENAKGEKDAKETILLAADAVHLVSFENTGTLELNDGFAIIPAETMKIVCGAVKVEIKGAATGLVGLVNKEVGASEAMLFEFSQEKGKSGSGKCIGATKDCEKLGKEPLEANLSGKFESAGEQLKDELTFSKMLVLKT